MQNTDLRTQRSPLANLIPTQVCDPHRARVSIPASMDLLVSFLQPGGQVENFCSGVCDGAGVNERPSGSAYSCDPAE